ncbi:MAG TPA: response regulator [Candidatus Saccharimonadales bacterium]|nr:response regulator [Candidatus Saccharimonadales bacterium]
MDQTKTILIIDDDKTLLDALAGALTQAGYKTLTAGSGQEGLELAKQAKPDLTLLDYQMPEMNGIETLEQLRRDDWGRKAKVVITTNIYDLNVVNQALANGVSDYLLKADNSLDEIVRQVEKHVS